MMPLVLIIGFLCSSYVGAQALLLVTEVKMFAAYQSSHQATLILKAGEKRWWQLYESGQTTMADEWEVTGGRFRYTMTGTYGEGYQAVNFFAETGEDIILQHRFHVKTEFPPEEEDEPTISERKEGKKDSD
ncbi:hypothetical protein [Geomicrobium sp. JCM 19037]|uniref:hypothetical protein n=1 Tax=Geomicrobium sp. JCM 19037 TaxID=1460634 RepID=UPI0005AB62DC|nr:hypothetical protein [Geomicrobium sp. JCM 19037]